MAIDYNETENAVPEDDNAFMALSSSEKYEMISALFYELREAGNTRQFLETQNMELKEQAEHYKKEIDGLEVIIASTKDDIELTLQRSTECIENAEGLQGQMEKEIEAINNIQTNLKTVHSNNKKCLILKEHLSVEFESLNSEKTIVFNKLKDIEAGVKKICGRKNAHKVPYLRAYDTLLKRIYHAFQEAENRMEVSLKLLH